MDEYTKRLKVYKGITEKVIEQTLDAIDQCENEIELSKKLIVDFKLYLKLHKKSYDKTLRDLKKIEDKETP